MTGPTHGSRSGLESPAVEEMGQSFNIEKEGVVYMMDCDDFVDYLCGVVFGDGDLLYDKRRGYRIRITDSSVNYLEMLRQFLSNCFSVRSRIYRHKKHLAYQLVIWRKDVYQLVSEKTPRLLAKPTCAFVAGIIDAEGGVNKTKHGLYRLYITNKDKRAIDAVARIFNEIGVRYYLSYDNRRYRLYIHGIDRVKTVLKYLPVIHPKIRDKFTSFLAP